MICLECYSDLALVKSLIDVPIRETDHEFGKGNICNALKKRTSCKALIDEDPGAIQPRYIKSLKEERGLPEQGLKVLHDSSRGHHVIVLCPALEAWVIKAASEAGIDMRDYGLSREARGLHSEINLNLDKFEKLLEALKSKGSSRLKALKSLLERG